MQIKYQYIIQKNTKKSHKSVISKKKGKKILIKF